MKRTSLTIMLPIAFVTSMMVLMIGYASFSLSVVSDLLITSEQGTMKRAAQRAVFRIDDQFDVIDSNLQSTARSDQTQTAVRQLSVMVKALGADAEKYLHSAYVAGNPFKGMERENLDDAKDRSAYSSTHAKMHDYFRSMRRMYGYYDVFLFDEHGTVIYTVVKEGDLGKNAFAGELGKSNLGSAFVRAWEAAAETTVFEDFKPYFFSNGDQAAFLATPVFDDAGKRIGVLAVQMSVDGLSEILVRPDVEKPSYKFNLIGPDGTYRMNDGTKTVGKAVPASAQLDLALAGGNGIIDDTVNAEGLPVLASVLPITAHNSGWTVVIEVSRDYVTDRIWAEAKRTAISASVMLLFIGGLAMMIGRWIASPLASLTQCIKKISDRETVDIAFTARRDEVGDIARGLARFQDDQRAADADRLEMLFKGKAFATTATAMLITDSASRILFANAAATRLMAEHAGALGKRFPELDASNLVGSDAAPLLMGHDGGADLMASAGPGRSEHDLNLQGTILSIVANTVDNADKSRAGFVIVLDDVTEAYRSTAIVHAIQQGQVILEMDPDGIILTANDIALQTYGYTRTEAVGQHYGVLFKSGMAEALDVLARVRRDGHMTELHHRKKRSGADLWALCNLNVIRDRNGKIVKILAICTERTTETVAQQRSEAEAKARSEEQACVVDALSSAMAALAAGDLAHRIAVRFPPAYEQLRADCNAAAQGLSDTLQQVAKVAENILKGANEIAESADDLSRRTESQAATLEETAAALDNLTDSVKSATDGTKRAGSKVVSAHDEARQNGAVVQQSIEAMQAIEQSSQKITQIIGVIDDIAFQTNLLALNAGVEAARAGDAGRGFAVVAAEVRALAQRSSEAAREIKALISSSEEQVSNGAKLVKCSGEVVEAILTDVAEISGIVAAIAQSSMEQANSLAEINSGVSMLDAVTQKNAVMVEHSTAASRSLKQEVDHLATLLQGFTLGSVHDGGTRMAAA